VTITLLLACNSRDVAPAQQGSFAFSICESRGIVAEAARILLPAMLDLESAA
jgi:hypothetical protein